MKLNYFSLNKSEVKAESLFILHLWVFLREAWSMEMKSLCLSFFSFPLIAPACFSCLKHTNLSSHFSTLGGNFIWTTSLLYISLAWMSAFICHSIWSTHLTPAHFRWDGSLVHTHFLSVFLLEDWSSKLTETHIHEADRLGGYETTKVGGC